MLYNYVFSVGRRSVFSNKPSVHGVLLCTYIRFTYTSIIYIIYWYQSCTVFFLFTVQPFQRTLSVQRGYHPFSYVIYYRVRNFNIVRFTYIYMYISNIKYIHDIIMCLAKQIRWRILPIRELKIECDYDGNVGKLVPRSLLRPNITDNVVVLIQTSTTRKRIIYYTYTGGNCV